MFELTHPARTGILRLAATKPIRHRDVLMGSGLSPSEATRHVRRLLDCGTLEKNRDGSFKITSFGNVIIERLNTFEFISRNSQYIGRQDFSSVPLGFDVFRVLRVSEIIEGTMDIVNAIIRISANSKLGLSCMFDEFNDSLVAIQAEKLRQGLEINIITTGGKRLPTEYIDSRMLAIKVRTFGKIPFFLLASETESLICFRTKGGKVDYSIAFQSSKPDVMEWCAALFNFYWLRGKDIVL